MRITITGDVADFERRAKAFLRRDPLRYTVLATIIANRTGGLDNSPDAYFLTAYDGDTLRGVVTRVGGREIYVSELPTDGFDPAVRALAEVVPGAGGVEGADGIASRFAARWSAVVGVPHRVSFVNVLYRLDALESPDVAGTPRRATESDRDVCVDWTRAMRVEAGIPDIGWDAVAMRRRIAAGRWWLWERDGEPVSLAAHQIPAYGVARVGPVYTPPAERGNGYASAVSAHVSHTLRTRGLAVCLFADKANPTSNKIYRDIGFRPVGEFPHYVFD
ncbi:GNAT family N-acetyltransferase [Nocardia bovistercoris]|uniref:GNAT family N-acetyltransferase n=1 Tax=Nocardia bovistercoris TaxID=2785916 RepID=A0A931N1B7_9NOCA|nr:GNAT family N-acetyltransferase [Nocardia bovistercoris]MBH0775819.1 GNAT family N-acetyltransferase [Nocardia bovistercoris]